MCRFTSPASRKRLCMLMFFSFITPISQGPPGGGGLAQGRQQPRPADWTSLRPAVAAAELREDQVAGLDGRTRLERDAPGPDPCAQLTPVGGVTLRAEPVGVRVDIGVETLCVCVLSSARRWQSSATWRLWRTWDWSKPEKLLCPTPRR